MRLSTLFSRVRSIALPVVLLVSVIGTALVGAAGSKWS
jgi:hypothetical protein